MRVTLEMEKNIVLHYYIKLEELLFFLRLFIRLFWYGYIKSLLVKLLDIYLSMSSFSFK